jgi:multidrug resistance protein MdtO
MATAAQSLRHSPTSLGWIYDFLKEELAPYEGRVGLVARMVLAATLIMIICETFRIPYGFQGAIFALLITRESPRATVWASVRASVGIALSALYVLATVRLVISLPSLHFFWIIGTFFVAFYILSTITDYATATTFAIVISVTVPLWDRYVTAQTNVEDTLWVAFVVFLGTGVTAAVELLVARRKPGDEVVSPIIKRLAAVEEMLTHLADQGAVDDLSKKNVIRYAILGTSRMRRLLHRSDYSQHYQAQMNAVLAAVGRLVDGAASSTEFRAELSESERQKLRKVVGAIESVRERLLHRQIPEPIHISAEKDASSNIPWLYPLEEMVSLIPQAFTDSDAMGEYVPAVDDEQRPKLFNVDAFSSLRHAKFALRGCMAASIAYVIYNAIDWPGISTAVTTCLLTALSTIGSSRQKQVLRFAGAAVGGFVFGMGAQIFILPFVDTIFGFTLLFVFVTIVSAWFLTSGPRLSYFGLQVALAFYLINLQEFTVVTSLSVARDRVVGVLLGLFTMWLVFDQLWGVPALTQMKRIFVQNFRVTAEVMREPQSDDPQVAKARRFSLRETILENFDNVRAAGDAVLLEFGPSRREALQWRSLIQSAQPSLRTLYLMRMAIWKYRAQTPGFELPQEVLAAQQEFDNQSAMALDGIADRLERKPSTKEEHVKESFEHLEQVVAKLGSQEPRDPREPQVRALLTLSRRSEQLTLWLAENV